MLFFILPAVKLDTGISIEFDEWTVPFALQQEVESVVSRSWIDTPAMEEGGGRSSLRGSKQCESQLGKFGHASLYVLCP